MDSTHISRGKQLTLLRLLRLPSDLKTNYGQSVATGIVKSVLRAIDDYDGGKGNGCWAAAKRIAKDIDFSESAVTRSIEVLGTLGAIAIKPRPGMTSILFMNWLGIQKLTFASGEEVDRVNASVTLSPGDEPPHPQGMNTLSPGEVTLSPGDEHLIPGGRRNVIETKEKRKLNVKGNEKRVVVIDAELISFIDWWNTLKERNLVSVGASKTPSKTVATGWHRVKKSKELRELLIDRPLIEAKLRESTFVREGSWFDLPCLFGGKNKTGEYKLARLLQDQYRDSAGSKPKTANVGPGVTYNPARKIDNGKF